MGYKKNDTVRELIYVMDSDGNPVTGLINTDFNSYLYKDGYSTSESITITEKDNGYYWMTFVPVSIGNYAWQVFNSTYQPEGWFDYHLITENNIDDVKTDTSNIVLYALRLLGLSQENTYIDTTVYDSNNNMTSARLRIYSDSASVGSTSNVLATYTITSTFNSSSELQTYKMVKE